jgi:hypothetical protein
VADSYPDYLEWKFALENFIVQTQKIQTMYNFSEKLGEGTFGQVILGLPKNYVPPQNNIHNDEEHKIGHMTAISAMGLSGMIGHIPEMKTPTIAKVAIKILNK